MQGLHILNIYPETIADGYGLRYAIYLAGCRHACPGCHNPASWHAGAGQPLTASMLDAMVHEINANPLLDGITLTGGDPFYNPPALYDLLVSLSQATGQNIWCYTGYTYEEILRDEAMCRCLPYIDTLVDGRFVQALYDPALSFRGSSNQRILHLQPHGVAIMGEGGYRP